MCVDKGNLVSVIMMGRLGLLGLKPLFLVGGATGLIGDPSGKSKERVLLDEKVVDSNIASIQAEITRIYGNIQGDLTKNQL
jgi:tyrosyl-tRNA synthetase